MEIQLKIISSLSIVKVRATRHLKAQNPNFSSNNFIGSKSGNYFLNWCNINIYWSVKIHEKSFFQVEIVFFLVHHIFMKRLTKLGLGHVKTFLRSFWAISIDIKNPYGNELWVEKYVFLTKMIISTKYSTSVEISAWKYFFQKVWIMGYIFHISHAWKWEISGRGAQKWLKNRFSMRYSSICIVWPPFKVRYVHTILDNVTYTPNIFLPCMENFLDGVEVLIDHQIQLKLQNLVKILISKIFGWSLHSLKTLISWLIRTV